MRGAAVGTLVPILAASAATISCMGDSITRGSGALEGRAWPAVLEARLGGDWRVRNFGKSGRTVMGLPDAYTATAFYRDAMRSGADINIIMLGTNDAKTAYWDREAFVEAYRALLNRTLSAFPRTLLGVPPPQLEGGWYWTNASVVNDEMRPLVRDIAAEFGLPLFDTPFNESMYSDLVHPNDLGYSRIATRALRALGDAFPDLFATAAPSAAPSAASSTSSTNREFLFVAAAIAVFLVLAVSLLIARRVFANRVASNFRESPFKVMRASPDDKRRFEDTTAPPPPAPGYLNSPASILNLAVGIQSSRDSSPSKPPPISKTPTSASKLLGRPALLDDDALPVTFDLQDDEDPPANEEQQQQG